MTHSYACKGSPRHLRREKIYEQTIFYSKTFGFHFSLMIFLRNSPESGPRYDTEPTAMSISPKKLSMSSFNFLELSFHLIFSTDSPWVRSKALSSLTQHSLMESINLYFSLMTLSNFILKSKHFSSTCYNNYLFFSNSF